jgi:hypothetical protein
MVFALVAASSTDAQVWSFDERILDQDPLANNRTNDIQISDIHLDGR